VDTLRPFSTKNGLLPKESFGYGSELCARIRFMRILTLPSLTVFLLLLVVCQISTPRAHAQEEELSSGGEAVEHSEDTEPPGLPRYRIMLQLGGGGFTSVGGTVPALEYHGEVGMRLGERYHLSFFYSTQHRPWESHTSLFGLTGLSFSAAFLEDRLSVFTGLGVAIGFVRQGVYQQGRAGFGGILGVRYELPVTRWVRFPFQFKTNHLYLGDRYYFGYSLTLGVAATFP
jgi:hypothetical protein